MEKRQCPECKNSVPVNEFQWTHDRYGIPWRKVCFDCCDKVQAAIVESFTFDEGDAGESLEPEDY